MSPAQDRKTAAIAGQAGRFQARPVTLLPIVYPFISLTAYEEEYNIIVYPPKPSLREASVTYTHIVYHIMGLLPLATLSLSIQ